MTELAAYADRPLTPPDPEVLGAIEAGPIDPSEALPLAALDRLLDPAPLAVETGWCRLPDGVTRLTSGRGAVRRTSARRVTC